MPDSSDAEPERWLSDLLRQFRRRSLSASEDSELGRELRHALTDTPYAQIYQSLLGDAHGADATALKARADEAFDAARVAHRDDRPRTCILHLYFALAANMLAGDIEDAATSLGDLATEFGVIGHYAKALPIQRAALLLKRRFQNSPENVARSLYLIGLAEYYRGHYSECIASLQEAHELNPLPEEWSNLQQKAERALELQRRWGDAWHVPVGEPAADCMREADRRRAAGDAVSAAIWYGRAAARARLDHEADVEVEALVRAADLFQQPLNMYAEAAAQAGAAATLAHSKGAFDREASADRIQAQALMETGSFLEACAVFEAGLAALQRMAPSVLELELRIGLAYALYSCDKPDEAGRQLEQTLEDASPMDPGDELQRWYIGSGRLFQRTDHLGVAIRILTAGIEHFETRGIAVTHVAGMLEALARCYFVADQPEAAISILDRAITHAEQAEDELGIGWIYLDMAWAFLHMNNVDSAEYALKQAEPHVTASGEARLAEYFYSTGYEVSTLQLRRLVPTLTEDPDATDIATAGQFATIHMLRALINEAASRHDAATARVLVGLHRRLGAEHDRAGQFGAAGQAYMAALAVVRKWKLTELRGNVMQDIGVLLARSGRIRSARRMFSAALAGKDRYAQGAERLTSLTSLAQADQILQRQLDYYSLASQIETEAKHVPADQRASILIQVAALYKASGHLAEARLAISTAIEHLRSQGPKERLVIAFNTAAEIDLADGKLIQAEDLGRESLATLEAQRPYVRGETEREWQKYRMPALLVLIETLFQAGEGRSADALQILETAKVRSMLRRFGRWQVQQPAEFPADLQQAEDEILVQLRVDDYLDDLGIPAAREVSLSSDDRVYAQAQEFWDSLPPRWHAYGQLRQGKPLDSLGLIRDIPLEDSPHFIVLLPTEERTLVWHIAPGGSVASWRSVPVTHNFAAGLGQEVLTAVARQEPLTDTWRVFSHELTGSWLGAVPEGATVCFVPSRSLIELPFALLTTHDGYLVERNPIACLPSLSLLAYWVGSRQQPGVRRPVVLGDSRGDLPGARREARSVAQRVGTEAMLGVDVVRSRINDMLAICDLLHISCHARFDHNSPERSGFVLADGSIFSARDGLKLRLNSHLAVLSACESGRLNIEAGDELTGLASSLLSAGVRSVAATSWRVPDSATAHLIDEFYSGVIDRQVSVACALRDAQLSVYANRKYSLPYYWAAFRVLGDWRNSFAGESCDGPAENSPA